MSNKITVRWQDWSGTGLEHLVLREDSDGITAEAVILATTEAEDLAARYRISATSHGASEKPRLLESVMAT